MRVDRNGSRFALLLLEESGESAPAVVELTRFLERRLRATDRWGFFDEHRLGILLTDTDAAGAQALAHELGLAAPRTSLAAAPRIYVYPVDAMPISGKDDPGRRVERLFAADELFAQPLPRWKRLVDIVGACVGLVLTLPLMIVAAAAIKATSPGPILFQQARAGLGGQPFTIYKLRTMRADAERLQAGLRVLSEQDGPAFKIKDDPRVTPVGRCLRKTCLDELPQLWNVLRGEMSLVGPRPLPCDEAAQCTGWQRRRLNVTPGLTCTWQVSGGMRIPFVEWMRMDLRYAASRRLWHDFALMGRTFIAVLLSRASH